MNNITVSDGLFFVKKFHHVEWVKSLRNFLNPLFQIKSLRLALIFTLAFASEQVWGQSTFSGTGNWSDPARWSAGVPDGATAAIIENGANCTVDIAGAVCASLTFNANNANSVVTISGANDLTISGAITFIDPLVDNFSQTIAVGDGTLVCGSISMANTTNNLRTNNITANNGTLTVNGNITLNGANNENYITYTGTGIANITGNITGVGRIDVNGATINLTGSCTTTGSIISTTGTINVTGNLTGAALFTAGTGTVNYNGAGAQNVGAYAYYNLQTNNGGTKTLVGNTTINNVLTLNMPLSVNTRTLTLNSATAQDIQGTPTNLITAAGSSLIYNGNGGTITIPSSVTALTGLTINNTSGVSLGANLTTLTGLTLQAGVLNNSVNNISMAAVGAIARTAGSLSAALTNYPTTFNVFYNGGTSITTGFELPQTATIALNNLTINTNGTNITLADYISNINVAGNLAMANTSSLIYSNTTPQTINVTGTFSGTSLNMSGGNLAHNLNISNTMTLATLSAGTGSTITLQGSIAQALPAIATYNNITLSNTGAKSIAGNVTVSGILTLNQNLSIGNFNLTLNTTGTVAGTFGTSAMIITNGSGNLVKQGNSAAAFETTYPVGNSSNYSPLIISSLGTTTVTPTASITIRSIQSVHPITTVVPNMLNKYWIVSTANLSGLDITGYFQYNDPDEVTGTDASFVAQRFTSVWNADAELSINNSTDRINLTNASNLTGDFTANDVGAFFSDPDLIVSINAGAWDNAANWSPATIPNAAIHNVYIKHAITGSGSIRSINDLKISPTGSLTLINQNLTIGGSLLIQSGGSVTLGNGSFTVIGISTIDGTINEATATGTNTFTGDVTIGGIWNFTQNVTFGGSLYFNGTSFTSSLVNTFTNTANIGGSKAYTIGTITVSGGTLTNTNTNATSGLTINTALNGAGTFQQGNNTLLTIIPNSITISGFDATAADNTVYYNTNALQTIKATTYHHLRTNLNTKTLEDGAVIVNGNLTVVAGILQSAASNTGTLTVAGTLTNTGTLTMWRAVDQYCNITLNGNSITGNGTYTFNDLTLGGSVVSWAPTSIISIYGNFTDNTTTSFSAVAGTFLFRAPVSQTIDGTSTGSTTFSAIQIGSAVTDNTILILNRNIITTNITFSVSPTGALSINDRTLIINGNHSRVFNGKFVGSASSVLTINGSGNPTSTVLFDATTPGTSDYISTLTINRASAGIVTLGTDLSADDITISQGSLATAFNVNIYGNLTNNGTFNQTANTTTFDKNGTQSITTSGTPTATTFNNLSLGGANNPTVNANIGFNVRGNLTQNSTNPFTANTGVVSLSAAAAQSIQGAGSGLVTFYNLTATGGNTKTIARDFTVSNLLTVNAANILQFDGTSRSITTKDLTVAGTFNVLAALGTTAHALSISGTLTNTGTINMRASATELCNVTITGSSVSGNGAYTFNDLTIGGNALTWSSTSNINIFNNFTNNTTISFVASAGTFTFSQIASQNINGTSSTTTFNSLYIGNNNACQVTLGTNIRTNGTLTINTNIAGYLDVNGNTLTINGLYTRANSGQLRSNNATAATANLILSGSGVVTGTLNFIGAPDNVLNVLTHNRTANSFTLGSPVVVNGTLNLNQGTLTNGVNLTMGNNATIVRSNSTALLSATPTAAGVYNVNYTGAVTTSFELPTLITALNNLIINPGAGNEVTLNAVKTVNGIITFTTGYLNIANFDLTLAAPATTTGSGASSFIRCGGTGSLIKQGTLETDFQILYPVGTSTEYTPIEITSLASDPIVGTATITIRSIGSKHPLTSGTDLSLIRYWTITPANLTINSVDGSFVYADADINGGTETNFTTVGRNAASGWNNNEAGTSIDHGTNTISLAGATQLGGEWTAGDPAAFGIPSYTTSQNGNWNTGATWVGGVVPPTGANVIIEHTVAHDANITVTDLTVNSAGVLTLGNFTFSVLGTSTIDGTIIKTANTNATAFNGDVTIGGTWNFTQNVSFGGNLIFNGTSFTSSATNTFRSNANIGGSNPFSIGTVSVNGGAILTNTSTDATSGLTINTALSGAGSFQQGPNAILTFVPATIAVTGFTATALGNTVYYNSGGVQTVKATTYHHLKTNQSTKTFESGDIIVNGDLTVVGGILQSAATNTGTLLVKGNISNAGALNMWRVLGTQYCDVTIDANTTTVSGIGTFIFNNLTVQNTSLSWTGNGAVSIYGNFTDNTTTQFNATAGTFYFLSAGAQAIGGTGPLTSFNILQIGNNNTTVVTLNKGIVANNNLTLNISGVSPDNGFILNGQTVTINGTTTNTRGTFDARTSGGYIVVNGNNTAAMTLAQINGTLSGLTINKTGTTNTVTLTNSLAVTDVLASNGTLTTAANLTVYGDFTNNATFSQTANTTTFDKNGTQNITTSGTPIATTFFNLTFGGANNPTVNTNISFNVSGNITQNSSNPFTASTGTITLPGTMSIQGAGIGFVTFYNLAAATAGTKTITRSFDVSNDITVAASTLLFNTATPTIVNVTGNVSVAAGAVFQVNNSAQTHSLNITGNLTNDGTFTMWRAAGQTVDVSINGSTISGNGTYNFNNLTLGGNAAMWNSTSTISMYGGFTDNTTISFTSSAGTFLFRSGAAQAIDGTSPGTTTFNAIQIGQAVGDNTVLTLNRDVTTTNITFNVSATGALSLNEKTFVLNGNHIRTNNGKFTGSPNAVLTINGSGNPSNSINFDITTPGTTNNFHTFTINRAGSGVVTLTSAIVVSNTLNLQQGTLTNGAFLTMGNNSTIIRSNSTALLSATPTAAGVYNVTYNAAITSSFELPAGASILNNLTIDPGAGNEVTLAASRTLNGILTFTSGYLNISNFDLTLASTASISGAGSSNFIRTSGTGFLIRQSTVASDFQMVYPVGTLTEYTPFTITTLNAAPVGTATISVRSTNAQHPLTSGTNLSLVRYWTVTPTNLTLTSVDGSFVYADSDIGGGAETNFTTRGRNLASVWFTDEPGTAIDHGTNTVSLTGAAQISGDWTAGDPTGIVVDPNSFTTALAGGWDNPATWVGGVAPSLSSHNVYIKHAVTGASNKSINNMRISPTGSLAPGAWNFTVGGDLLIENGGSLTIANGNFTVTGASTINGTYAESSAAGTTTFTGAVTINGIWNITAAQNYTFGNNLTFNGTTFTSSTGTYNFDPASGSANIGGSKAYTITNLSVANTRTLINTNTETITGLSIGTTLGGTGTFQQGGNSILTFLGASIGVTGFTATAVGNTVYYNGPGAQTVRATTYHHLKVNSSTKTLENSATTINGDLTLVSASGIIQSGNLSTGTLLVYGNIINTGGAMNLRLAGAQYCDVTIDANSTSVSGTGTFSFNNLTIQNTNLTWTGSGLVSMWGSFADNTSTQFNATANTFQFLSGGAQAINGTGPSTSFFNLTIGNNNTSIVTLNKNIGVNNTLTLNVSGGSPVDGFILNGQTLTLNGTTINTRGTIDAIANGGYIVVNGNNTAAMTLAQINGALNQLTINKTGTNNSVTLNALNPLSVTDILISNGTLATAANLIVYGDLTNNGTFNQTASTTTFDKNGTQNITTSGVPVATTFNNLTFGNTNNPTVNTNVNFNVNGNFTQNSSNPFTASTGTLTLNLNGAQTITGAGAGTVSFYNLTTATGGTKTIARDFSVSNLLTVNAGTTLQYDGTTRSVNTKDLTIAGTLNVAAAGATSHSLSISGALNNTGIINLRAAATQYCDITITGNSITGNGAYTFNNLTFGGGAVVWTPTSTINMYGNFTDNTTTSFSATAGRFTFLGGIAQSIAGTSTSTTFFNFTASTNGTIVNLNKNITVAGTAASTTTGDAAAFGVESGTPAFNANSYSVTITGAGGTFVNEAATTSSFNCGTGTVIFNSGATNSINLATSFYDLTINSGTVTTVANITILNNFTNNATFNHTTTTFYFDKNGSQNITTTGTPVATSFNNIQIGNTNNPQVNCDISYNINGNFINNSSGIGGGGTTAYNATAGTTTFLPNVAQSIGGAGTGTVNFNNLIASINTKTANIGFNILGNLTISNGATLNLGTTTKTVTVNGSATIDGILNFGSTAANPNTFTIGGDLIDITGTITMQTAGLAHILNLGGTNNAITTFSTTAASGSVVNYNRAGNQQVFAGTYQNLTISNGGTKTLAGNITIGTAAAGILTLDSGILQLSNYNLTIANNSPAAIVGAFDASHMIATDGPLTGTGYLQKNGTIATDFQIIYPVGSGGYYTPMEISSLAATLPTLIKVKAVPVAINPSYINKYWDVQANRALTNVTATFTYDPAELNGATFSISYSPNAGTTWQNPPASGVPSFGANSFTITGNTPFTGSVNPFNGLWTMGLRTYYSYQTGNWSSPTTWTSDPSGTLQIGTTIPGTNDNVVILSGRTVSLTGNIATSNLNVTIEEGGFIDQTIYQFTQPLQSLKGQGTLRLASVNFPTGTTTAFTNSGGGTTEYNNAANFNLPASQNTYNNLTINANGFVATQLHDITLNGNLYVKQGTYRINDDVSAAKRNLTIIGNVTVDNTAFLTVGKGATNTTTNPLLIIGGTTAPFLDYYTQFHSVIIKGDFTNNGTVRFTNLSYPVYDAFPPTASGATSGAASVYFQGLTDNTITCDGQTDFYNLILDKGTDQTYRLTIASSDYSYFRLFGANTSGGDITNPATTTANPNLKKALWIRTGTLVLQGLVVIPSLTEGNCNGAPTSDYFIPSNGALVLDGSNVIVLSTADDYDEVNLAYTVTGGSGFVNGVSIGNCSALSILGKLQVNDGYLSTRESGGILTWDYSPGRLEINGGIVDAKQFRAAGGASDIGSFLQTDGTLMLRGRFQRTTTSFTAVTDLAAAPLNTVRANDALIDGTIGSFGLNVTGNVFSMTGGTIQLFDATDITGRVFDVLSSAGNINVSGGLIECIPTLGTGGSADAVNHIIRTTSPFGNLTINRASGTSVVQLENSYPLTVQKDLTIQTGSFNANNLDVSIGGNLAISAGTTYTTGTNTTILNGSGAQTFTVDLAAPLSLNKLRIDKPAGRTLTFAGSQQTINVADNFWLIAGNLADNGNTINVAKDVFNSGIHTGSGKIVLNGAAQVQAIDGNGTFQNLELNNTNAAAAPVSLSANTTINGALTLSQDKLFNIKTFNLRLNSTASIVNAGANRYIQTSGTLGDGGVTRVYPNSTAFVFPLGAASTSHALPAYTPASIGFTGTPTYGSITVNPVGYEHPTTTTNGRSLTYFWRVKSSGFTLGAATVTHGYTYDQSDVVTGANITEDGYVAARYSSSALSWTQGVAADVDETSNIVGEPGTGSFLQNVSFIDGDYTAGDNSPVNPFGAPTIYYSRINGAAAGSGLWSDVNTWSTISHTDVAASSVPGGNDVVIIGGRDSVYLATTVNARDFDPRSCASLQIEVGSALDIGNNPASNFNMVLSHPSGNGNFRFTCNSGVGGGASEPFIFPLGDYSDFNANQGTTEAYTTNPSAGSIFFLPNGVFSYGNLILSPLGGSNIIFANNDLLIYGDLVTRGQNADSWFCPTWVNQTNYPTPPTLPVAKTITILGDLDIQGGGFIWIGNGGLAQDVVVNGNVIVAPWGAMTAWTGWGGADNQSLKIGGSLINNTNNQTGNGATQTKSTVNFNNGASIVPVTFFGSNNASITSTPGAPGPLGPETIFNRVTVNKGTSQSTTLTIDIRGVLTTLTDNWLTLQNGTLRFMPTNPATDFTISTTTPFTIPSSAGLLINYSNSGARNVLIANSGGVNTNDLFLDGKLTLVNGNLYVGPIAAPATNNDIEYGATGSSTIDVQGGQLVVNGQIRRNAASTSGVLKYTQSGGSVTINGNAALATRGKLEVVNAGSIFNMSGASTLTIVRGGGTTFGDLYLRPASSTISGGSIIFTQTPAVGPAVAAIQSYLLESTVPLNDLVITGDAIPTVYNASLGLMVSPLTINGGLTLSNANSILSSNNNNITIKGGFVNNGTYNFGTNTTTFSGGTQSISGTTVTNFYDLNVSPVTSLTPNSSFTVNRNLTIGSGILALSNKKITLLGNLTNNATYTDDNTIGGVSLSGAAQQQISGTGSFGKLELNNTFGAKLNNSISLQNDLSLTQGVLDINQYQLTLGQNSLINGAPFSITKMIISNGVATSLGLRKFFNIGATNFTFPVGVLGKYTPAIYSLTANATVGSITVNPVNDHHPTTVPFANVLKYYWEIESSGVSDLAGTLLLQYLPGDVNGIESDYVASQLLSPGTYWSKATPGSLTDNVDETNHQITYTIPSGTNNLTGDYTAGDDTALPDEVPTYQTNKDGDWTDNTIWDPVGSSPACPSGGPSGFNVIIDHVVETNSNYCFAYNTTINGTLKILPSTFGHNLGSINGGGTLYLESPNLPAGNYLSFFDCTGNGTLEYGGSTNYTLIATLYSSLPNIIFSGTGTRTLPNKDLTICNKLEINGPTLDNSVYNRTLTILGTIERISGNFNAGTGANATVSFAGTSLQTVGGALGNFSGSNRLNNLEVNNSSGLDIGAGGSIEVGGTLKLTNGIINTSATNVLTVYNSSSTAASPTGGSSTSFVNGPLVKRITAGGNFVFPLGKGTEKGHAYTVTSTSASQLYWTSEFFTPNSTANSVTAPLQATNTDESWSLKTTTPTTAKVKVAWDLQSALNPTMTQSGISDMRIAEYNSGTSKWVALTSTTSGTSSAGDVATTNNVSINTTAKNYTTGSVTTTTPRASFNPSGPVCGAAGIPLRFTSFFTITLPYTIYYTVDGGLPLSAVVATLPFTLPTPIPGSYQLTGFKYDNSTIDGVVDSSPVNAWAIPTTANAGPDQPLCGLSGAILIGNNPAPFTGLWSIVTGTGGTILSSTNDTSVFNGNLGSTYTLRWTITSGSGSDACTSSDNVVIAFNVAAQRPSNFTAAPTPICQSSTRTYTVPTILGATFNWSYTGNGASIGGTPLTAVPINGLTNSVSISFDATATSGTLNVTATNGCGTSTARSVAITVGPPPTITLGANPSVCRGATSTSISYSATTGSPNQYSIVYNADAIAAGFINVTNAALPAGSIPITVPLTALATTYYADITVRNSIAVCVSTSYPIEITVNPLPTISLGANPAVCRGIVLANLSYSATTNSPDLYNIDFDATAEGQGFTDVTNAGPLATPIPIAVPALSAAGTYNATLNVQNSTTGCYSNNYNINVTVNPLPTSTITGLATSSPICDGDPVQINIVLTGQPLFDFTVQDDQGNSWNVTNLNVASGSTYVYTIPSNPWLGPTVSTTYVYTITGLVDDNGCSEGSPTGSATVVVYKKPETGPQYHIPNNFEL
ncbi:MAG: beta strand repeat-containing protein [Tenuifilaceae bacterium]